MVDTRNQAEVPIDPDHEIPYKAELSRKALHLLALVVPVGMALSGRKWSILILVPIALIALGADVFRVRSVNFALFINRIFGFMMRGEERPPIGGPISINGATWVLITAALLAILFPIHIASFSFGMFMVCDAAAALIGRRYGKMHWGNSTRTVEGSLAFFLTGLLITFSIPQIDLTLGITAVVVASLAEIPRRPLNDNFRAPLAAATVMYLVESFLLQ